MSTKEIPEEPPPPPAPADASRGSGEGADTALKALIRKRRQVERPDDSETLPPAGPPG